MKLTRISILLFIVAVLCGVSSCSQSDDEDLPVLDIKSVINNVIVIDNTFHFYTRAESNFLKNSSALNPDEIQSAQCFGDDLYLLFPDIFLHYDLITGNLLFRYEASEKVSFTDFTIDQSTKQAYILDNRESKVIELAMNGEIIKSVVLDTTHSYNSIKHLGDGNFLIPVQTIPHPSFLTVDFKQSEVKEYELINEKKKIRDIPGDSDSIWTKYPLYVTDETPRGVMVKYLFDDRIYLCTKDELKPDYLLNMGKQKVKRRYPWAITKFKNNDRFRIIKLWHTGKKIYVLSQHIVKNIRGTFDYKILSQFEDSENMKSLGSFVASTKLASLNPNKDEIFMDNEYKRFISIRKLTDEEKKNKDNWPKNMLAAENEDDLVVSVFTMK